jgi:DNA primase
MRTRDDVLRIKARSDICAVIQKSVLLKKAGKNYNGLCPLHQEKAPSFVVNPERNSFHCYSCNEGGDVISFVRKIHNLSFVEALDYLENFNLSQAEQKAENNSL